MDPRRRARSPTTSACSPIDLSGHGDSDHRDVYDLEQWTEEVVAVADAGGIDGSPVVVGHSMGGFVTIATAALHGDRLAGVIVCDSPVTEPDPEVESLPAEGGVRRAPHLRVGRRRPRRGSAPCRRRTTTSTTSSTTSAGVRCRPVDGGWQWKFDRRIFEQFAGGMRGIALPYLSAGQVPLRPAALGVRPRHSRTSATSMYEALGRVAPVIELPEAGHHAMLDQPLLLLTALRTLLADWDHSEPHRAQRS